VNGINSYNKTDEYSELSASTEPLTPFPPRSLTDTVTVALLPTDKRAPSDYIVSLARTSMQTGMQRRRAVLFTQAQTDHNALWQTQLSPPEIVHICYAVPARHTAIRRGLVTSLPSFLFVSLKQFTRRKRKTKDRSWGQQRFTVSELAADWHKLN